MAPVVRALRATDWARCVVVATAQHRDLLDQMLERLHIPVDHDLDLMQDGQQLSELLARMLPALDGVLSHERPAAVLAQGDTTTVLGAALAAFHRHVPFGHVEAGLRTYDLEHPFPEEGYRQIVGRIARWHFAPTSRAADALRTEGISVERICVTGNTCIDTLLQTVEALGPVKPANERLILLTAHRRESFGEPLRSVFQAVRKIVDRFPDVRVVYPVHPNPNVREPAHAMLSDHPRISLVEPLDYFEFVDLMRQSTLILTDSGGIQEEGPTLGKPVVVLRHVTERPEAVEAGMVRLVGTAAQDIESAVAELLDDDAALRSTSCGVSPYGDGSAGPRIVAAVGASLGEVPPVAKSQ